jgi:hypothetical protein
MFAERPVDTVNRWIHEDWTVNDVSREELVTKLHSISNETNRTPDSHYYSFRNGILLDPDSGDPILKHIAPGVEYNVAEELQNRVANTDEGAFIWNSPKLYKIYPCNKSMLYQIAYNANMEKVLLYSAILYDGDIENPEDHRKTLVSAPDADETVLGLLSWIEKVSKQKQDIKETGFDRQQASYYADQFKSGVDPRVIMEEMQASGFLGQNPISCPTGMQSFSNYTSAGANILIFAGVKDKFGSLEFPCSQGHMNKRPYGRKIKYCSTCGEDVSCGDPDAIAA